MVVDNTVESKENKEETTREFADIRMYHFSWNFLRLAVVMVVDITVVFIISTFVTTLRSCEFEVDNPVDGKDIKEEETMEVVDIRMYHFSAEIVHLLIDKWISRNNFELIFL